MKPIVGSLDQPQVDRRKLLLGLLFCSAAGLAAWRQPNKHIDYLGNSKLENIIPKTIGPWTFVTASGLVVPPNDQLSRTLYSQLLTRVYSDGRNPPIMLLIAQSGWQSGILQVHRPETCYPASGYLISPVTPHWLRAGAANVAANTLTAVSDGLAEQIIYWTRVGDKVPLSWRDQRIAVAEQNLRGVIPDAVLVRVSTVNSDATAARATLDAFIQAMLGAVPAAKRNVLVA
jgi:EpsI family protein